MLRVLAIVPAAFSVLASGSLHAEEPAQAQMTTQSTAEFAMVDGLAIDDLLNIRMKASPVEKVVGRLPNGATVRKYECEIVNGYEWCRVDAIEREGLSGWAPARYLQTTEFASTGTVASVEPEPVEKAASGVAEPGNPAAEPEVAENAAAEEQQAAIADTPDPALGPATGVKAIADSPPEAGTPSDAALPLPSGLDARFAGAPAASTKELPAEPEQAVALAFAPAAVPGAEEPAPTTADPKADKPSPDVAVILPPGLEERFGAPQPDLPPSDAARTALVPIEPLSPPAADEAVDVAAAEPAADDMAVIVPTPRPDPDAKVDDVAAAAAVAEPERHSSAAAPAVAPAAEETVGEVPCARYVGQPMARCQARVARIGDRDADVTVVWPDGGSRVIRFRDGAPEGSNSRGEFRFTREGSLSMIRIGVSERFEIVDELSFGG